jgi:hypothetical protein
MQKILYANSRRYFAYPQKIISAPNPLSPVFRLSNRQNPKPLPALNKPPNFLFQKGSNPFIQSYSSRV